MKPYKAPRLDGLHAGFFQRFWLIVGDSMRNEIKKAFIERKVPSTSTRLILSSFLRSKVQRLLGTTDQSACATQFIRSSPRL